MSTQTVRERNATFAFKIETTPGTDAIAGTPLASDYVLGDFEFDYDPQVIVNSEFTGTLDKSPDIVGGLRPNIRIRVPLRGSGLPTTAPDWGKIMRVCGMAEGITMSAVSGNLQSGTTTTATLSVAASAAANIYRGMPLRFAGIPFFTGIVAYSTGKVATLGSTAAAALNTASFELPENILYSPTSDEAVYKNGTIYFYKDGFRWIFTGVAGTWSLELTSGGIGFLVFELRGQLAGHTATAMPAAWNTVIRPTPPRWAGGTSQLGQAIARCRALTFRAGVQVVLPDNPEAAEAYDPAVPIERDSMASIDPLMDTGQGVTLFNNFRAGTPAPLIAMIGNMFGGGIGNRFLVTAPAARFTGLRPVNRDGLAAQEIACQLDGADSALYLCSF